MSLPVTDQHAPARKRPKRANAGRAGVATVARVLETVQRDAKEGARNMLIRSELRISRTACCAALADLHNAGKICRVNGGSYARWTTPEHRDAFPPPNGRAAPPPVGPDVLRRPIAPAPVADVFARPAVHRVVAAQDAAPVKCRGPRSVFELGGKR